MDIYKQKFTKLQYEIIRFLFANVGEKFNQREIALKINASPTAISNSIKFLKQEGFVFAELDKSSKTFEISLNINNEDVFYMKRVENLREIYLSGLKDFLEEKFPGKVIVLFGSFSRGEDAFNSDIDIAILEEKEKEVDIKKFEIFLNKKINLQFYGPLNSIHKNLRENILNGIVISGSFKL
ncbi:MAG TPA: nucleotidyltransferase domain-containing protein [Candidatus Nanoarchaeia archaeon]|nr:nucleotidyltransferase domain-containing protein [Candidatus Nanoarchaeia archaeon]